MTKWNVGEIAAIVGHVNATDIHGETIVQHGERVRITAIEEDGSYRFKTVKPSETSARDDLSEDELEELKEEDEEWLEAWGAAAEDQLERPLSSDEILLYLRKAGSETKN